MLIRYFTAVPHDPNFLGLKALNLQGLCLDLGANEGQSALSILSLSPQLHVLSIEPNSVHKLSLEFVKKFLPKKFDYRLVAVGEAPGAIDLFIPSVNGIDLSQEVTANLSSLQSEIARDRVNALTGNKIGQVRKISVPVIALDQLGLSPRLVKMDLQGMEMQALRGLNQTIQQNKPVFLIELSPEFYDIKNFLGQFGYNPYRFDPKSRSFAPYPALANIKNLDNIYFFGPDESFPLATEAR